MMDLDLWLEKVRGGENLTEDELKLLCDYVKEILVEESNVQPVHSPVTVCGDIHGQFHDLMKLFQTGGQVPDTNYIFMGDFVDRGYNSIEVFTILLLLKARYPAHITLLRGNHESRQITQDKRKCWRNFEAFSLSKHLVTPLLHPHSFSKLLSMDFMMSASGSMGMQMHGVFALMYLITSHCQQSLIDRSFASMGVFRLISGQLIRNCEIPHEGPFCDLMWSDPEDIDTWAVSPRGAGWLFGCRVTSEFNHINDLELVCRAHQLVQEGLKYMFEDKSLVTVWSAPNYCYRCGNVASILSFNENMERDVKFFTETEENNSMMGPRTTGAYFL